MQPGSGAQRVDVLIAGAGFAGLSLAIALRQALKPLFLVTVADPALASSLSMAAPLARGDRDPRASAIVAAARRLFEAIGVWQSIEAQPILAMKITDSRLSDVIR